MGIGGVPTSRNSPEASLPRSFNFNRSSSFGGRGGRGLPPPKPHTVPVPPPRKADILMEAGRLATEYLVSQGVLPPSVLSERWVNGGSKNDHLMEFQLTADGRTSALARLGNGVPEGFRNRPRRRMGPVRDYSYEWGRDNTKTASFLEKPQNSPDMDPENDLAFVQLSREERKSDVDSSGGGVSKVTDDKVPSDTVPHDYEFSDILGSRPSSSATENDVQLAADPEFSNASGEMKLFSMEIDKGKDITDSDNSEKQNVLEDLSMHVQQMESDIANKDGNDLLKLCSFAKVPTRTRSSLTVKGSKIEDAEETAHDTPLGGPTVSKENPSENLLNFMLSNETKDSKCLDSEVSRDPSPRTVGVVGVLDSPVVVKKDECAGPQSLLDRSVKEQESGQVLSEFGRLNSMVKNGSDKRALQDVETREGSKRPREWISTVVAGNDDYFHLNNFTSNPSLTHQSNAPAEVVEIVDKEKLFNVSLLPRSESEPGIEPKEEKQLFPHSFRICDLNLMESSDMTGTHDSDSVYGLPSTMEANKRLQVDVDLSMSNSCTRSDDYNSCATDANDTEVVDVEDDSAKKEGDLDTSEKKTGTAHSSLEDFQNHMDSTGDLPDAQDGYGLMISELLGNDISSCSSVPADITGLHNEMGLHNGAEILDDDPIYLTLGEIPISFLGGWEQPPQPFEKPF